jgi:hypothetical protein
MREIFISLLLISTLKADNIDSVMDGFDDEPSTKEESKEIKKESSPSKSYAIIGSFTQEATYSPNASKPHDKLSSFKSSLFLDFEYKFNNGFKFKTNGKAYYDSIYNLRDRDDYTKDEIDELESEIEIFDAYIEGSLGSKLDIKFGRQVVVWGRSDTIRVTDVINPLDNRRPAMVDIEDLRLPITMAKIDYFLGDWRITPIAILEQRFNKNPPFGGGFNPAPREMPKDKRYDDITPALSIGGEFSNWDINLYASQLRGSSSYLERGEIRHNRVDMFGTALNILSGSWLFKSEFAYLDGLKFSSTGDKEFKRADILFGTEYNGIADTMLSYDVVLRDMDSYDNRLSKEIIEVKDRTYQHAFRVSSDFLNATLKANYLISLYGSKLDEGGFQRAWFDYDISDGLKSTIGYVDYRGGSKLFDKIRDEDMIFGSFSYSF